MIFDFQLEFVRGLVQLTMEKLNEDIEEIFTDENLFAHLLDELLSFESELKEYLGWVVWAGLQFHQKMLSLPHFHVVTRAPSRVSLASWPRHSTSQSGSKSRKTVS